MFAEGIIPQLHFRGMDLKGKKTKTKPPKNTKQKPTKTPQKQASNQPTDQTNK